jgi:cyclopropane-fatty-acyl-phospholipid synthase
MCEAMTAKSDLKLTHLEDITPHYARTLMEWRANLDAREDEVRALGLDDRFLRTWHFYLAYCAGGFAERHIGNVQVLVARPFSDHPPILPPLS